MTMTKSPLDLKNKQQRNLLILAAALVLILWGTYALIEGKSTSDKKSVTSNDVSVSFASPLKKIDAEAVLLDRAQVQAAEQRKETDALKLQMNNVELAANKNNDDSHAQLALEDMRKELQALKAQVVTLSSGALNVDGKSTALNSKPLPGQLSETLPAIQGISEVELDLNLGPTAADLVPVKNPDTYVPSGTFVEAVMIGGADASGAVNAQGNPTPMVFRITEQGTLPNHAKSHLKDCVITAAVVGDISSERGMIRLETMSCTKPDNSIIDMAVEGTVYGPEGKNGVRGIPLWREGALLGRAAVAGTLSGFSSAIQQSATTSSVSALGSTQTVNSGEVAKYGAASGASSAMDKLADYEIQRAQQYHPVIQLSAGTKVDIVFLKGFFLDGKKHNDASDDALTQNAGARTELFNHAKGPSSSSLPLTDEQMQKLKQHESELGFSSQQPSSQG